MKIIQKRINKGLINEAMMVTYENFSQDGWEIDGEYEYYEEI